MKRKPIILAVMLILCIGLVIPVFANTNPSPNVETASSWARDDISLAINMGLVPQGLQSDYRLAATRADFAALAVVLYEYFAGEITGRETFVDTNDINVEKMAYLGVVQGVGRNRFAPEQPITREAAAVFLTRLSSAIGHPLTMQTPTFTDNSSISSWARESVGQMQSTGIMGGVSGNRFAPASPYTREQSIVSMLRTYNFIFELIEATQTPTPEPTPTPTPTPEPTPEPTQVPTPTQVPEPEPEPESPPETMPTPVPTPEPVSVPPGACP